MHSLQTLCHVTFSILVPGDRINLSPHPDRLISIFRRMLSSHNEEFNLIYSRTLLNEPELSHFNVLKVIYFIITLSDYKTKMSFNPTFFVPCTFPHSEAIYAHV